MYDVFFFNSVWRGDVITLLDEGGDSVALFFLLVASTTIAARAPSAGEKWTPAPNIAKPSAAPQVGHASKLQCCSRSRCPRSPPGSIMSLANDKAMCVGETKGLKLMP